MILSILLNISKMIVKTIFDRAKSLNKHERPSLMKGNLLRSLKTFFDGEQSIGSEEQHL